MTPLLATVAAHDVDPTTVGSTSAEPCVHRPEPLPVHMTDREIVDVTDFGADPLGVRDSATAVAEALAFAGRLGRPVTIVFPLGVYQLYPERAAVRELYVSNTVGTNMDYRFKTIGLLLEEMADVIIDGMGSRLVFHGNQTIVAVLGCTDVSIRNLETDWAAPGTLDLTVVGTGVSNGRAYRVLRHPRGVRCEPQGAAFVFSGEPSPATGEPYWSHGPDLASAWQNQIRDLATGTTLRSPLPLWDGAVGVSVLDGEHIQVTYSGRRDPADAGTVFQMRHGIRDTPGALIWESERVRLDGLRLGYLHGFGIVGQLGRDISLNDIVLRAHPAGWRQTAGFADFIQMSGVAGTVQITNSLFDNPHDDPINIHGTYLEVVEADPTAGTIVLEYRHPDTAGFPQFHIGDEIRWVSKSTMLAHPDGPGTVTAVNGPTGHDRTASLTRMSMRVEGNLPLDLGAGGYVAENLTQTPTVCIAGNTFRSVPTRGILVTTPRPVLIERNCFQSVGMASIYISADARDWYESSGADGVVIRNNLFDCPARDWPVIWLDPTNSENEAGRRVHRDVSIKANRFLFRESGTVLKARSVSGIAMRDNCLEHVGHLPATGDTASPAQALIVLEACDGVAVRDNCLKGVRLAVDAVDTPPSQILCDVAEPVEPCGAAVGGLAIAEWNGIDFGMESGSRAWYARLSDAADLSARLVPRLEGSTVVVTLDDLVVHPGADGCYSFAVESGVSVVQAQIVGRGAAPATYRWVVCVDAIPLVAHA